MNVWFPRSFFCVFFTILHFSTLVNGQVLDPWIYESNLTLTPSVSQNGSQVIQCSKAQPADVEVWMSNRTCSTAPTGNLSSFWPLTDNTTEPVIDSTNYYITASNISANLTVKIVTFLESNDGGAPTNCVCCVDVSVIESSNVTDISCKDVSLGNPSSNNNNNNNGSNNVDRLTVCQLALVLITFVHLLWS